MRRRRRYRDPNSDHQAHLNRAKAKRARKAAKRLADRNAQRMK